MADEVTSQEPEAPVEEPQADWDAEARKTGWTPQEQFRGDPDKWMDSKTWVERGKTFIPFLQAKDREHKDTIAQLQARLANQDRMLNVMNKSLEELKVESHESSLEDMGQQKEALMDEIARVHTDGDIKEELRLREKLTDLNDQLRAARAKPATPAPVPPAQPFDPMQDPTYKQWLADNEWFGKDVAMSGAALAIMQELNSSGRSAQMTPEQRFAHVAAETKRRFGMENDRRRAPNRMEGGRGDSGRGGPNGRDYESLPSDAKSQCDKLATRFVGKADARGNVKYKDLASYRAKYVQDFFAEDWGTKHLTTP
jgi:hypothetical protein